MITSDDGYERALSDLNAHAEQLEEENKRLRCSVDNYVDMARRANEAGFERIVDAIVYAEKARAALEGRQDE